jgi:hypothetical protein
MLLNDVGCFYPNPRKGKFSQYNGTVRPVLNLSTKNGAIYYTFVHSNYPRLETVAVPSGLSILSGLRFRNIHMVFPRRCGTGLSFEDIVEGPCSGIGQIDVFTRGEFIQDSLPNILCTLASASGFAEITKCKKNSAFLDGGKNRRGQVGRKNDEFTRRFLQFVLCKGSQVTGMGSRDLLEDSFRSFPIAFICQVDWHLVPDVVESPLGVVYLGLDKHLAVGYLHDTPGALIRMDPVADLQDGELKKYACRSRLPHMRRPECDPPLRMDAARE